MLCVYDHSQERKCQQENGPRQAMCTRDRGRADIDQLSTSNVPFRFIYLELFLLFWLFGAGDESCIQTMRSNNWT
jgi:hypothetical protein